MQEHPLEHARRWLGQARADFEAAEANCAETRYSLACFLCQQTAEKALKAMLIWLNGDYPRRHVIGDLLSELNLVDSTSAKKLSESSDLDIYYQSTRYPDAIGGAIPAATFHRRQAELAIQLAREVLDVAGEVLADAENDEN
jgi:HEPN domain-containing protein